VRALSAVAGFWTAPVRPEPVAAFRIALGTVLLADAALTVLPRLPAQLDPGGLGPAPAATAWAEPASLFTPMWGGPGGWEPWVWRAEAAAWVASLTALTLGWRTRAAAVAAWLLTVSLHNRLPWLLNGADRLAGQGLFYLMLARPGAVWSLDSRRGGAATAVPAWPVRLMQMHLCGVYLAGGLAKLSGPDGAWRSEWLDGSAVYWVLNDICLTRWPYPALPVPLWGCVLAGWAVVATELAFPLLAWFRRTRAAALWAGVALHVSVTAFLEVGAFGAVMLAWYPLFIPAAALRRWLRRARPRPPITSPAPPRGWC
jgi:hypothetical protein